MRTILRILAGIIGIPFVFTILTALMAFCLVIAIMVTVPCLAIWIALVFPFTFLFACFQFAFENKTEEFKCVKDSFITMADPTRFIREVLIPSVSDLYDYAKDIYLTMKKNTKS